jgi:Ca-activated chloride channel family protein
MALQRFLLATLLLASLAGLPSATANHMPCPPDDCTPLVPRTTMPILAGHVTITDLQLDVNAVDGLAVTRISLTIENNDPTDAELDVAMPMAGPLMAVNLTLDGRVLEGRVEEVGQARTDYSQAQQQGKSAVLIEQAAEHLIRLRVNLPTGQDGVLRLAYAEKVARASGASVYRFPLASIGLAPSEASVSFNVADAAGVVDLRFPELALTAGAAGSVFSGQLPDAQDLVAVWASSDAGLHSSLLLGQAAGQEGIGLATLCAGNLPTLARDVVFVLDTSGSMNGPKIVSAREALKLQLAALSKMDRYDVVTFDDQVITYHADLVTSTRSNIEADEARVLQEVADSGTDIDAGLQQALAIVNDGTSTVPMVVFLTDGLPSSGVTDHDQIIQRFRDSNHRHAIIEVVPIGLDADRTFLADLALRSGGMFVPVDANDVNLTDRIGRILDVVGHVQLADVTVSADGLDVTMDAHGVAYEDDCLTVALGGTFPASGDVTLHVKGKSSDGAFDRTFTFAAADLKAHAAVASPWGEMQVAHLLSQERVEGKDLRDEIVQTAIDLRQLTPYTAWIIADTQAPPQPTGLEDAAANGASYQYSPSAPQATPPYPNSAVNYAMSTGSASNGASQPGPQGTSTSAGNSTPAPGMVVGVALLAAALVARRLGRRL